MVSGSNGSKEEVDPPPENGDAAAQAVPDDDDSDVYVGNEITPFCSVVSREIVEYGPPTNMIGDPGKMGSCALWWMFNREYFVGKHERRYW